MKIIKNSMRLLSMRVIYTIIFFSCTLGASVENDTHTYTSNKDSNNNQLKADESEYNNIIQQIKNSTQILSVPTPASTITYSKRFKSTEAEFLKELVRRYNRSRENKNSDIFIQLLKKENPETQHLLLAYLNNNPKSLAYINNKARQQLQSPKTKQQNPFDNHLTVEEIYENIKDLTVWSYITPYPGVKNIWESK